MTSPSDCPVPTPTGPAPVLTAALTRLRSDFNAAFPGRDTSTDGWIGDSAHQDRTSGHNPDDTAGVSAEYSDSDSTPEVRAIDVDKDLGVDGVTMQDVVDRVLATPDDCRRLKYIIFDRHQWSKSNGWARTDYDGDNPHTEHAHFSGEPAYDHDDAPWSVATMGVGMDQVTWNTGWICQRLSENANPIVIPASTERDNVYPAAPGATYPNAIADQFDAIAARLTSIEEKLATR